MATDTPITASWCGMRTAWTTGSHATFYTAEKSHPDGFPSGVVNLIFQHCELTPAITAQGLPARRALPGTK